MSAPVNTGRVISHLQKRKPIVTNDDLIKLAGGSDTQWSEYLKGPKAQAIIYACNTILSEDGYKICSEGIHSQEWRLCTVAEAHRRQAQFNLERVGRPCQRAYDAIQAIIDDTRAPQRLRDDASAWLELFEEPQNAESLVILQDFGKEIAEQTKPHKAMLRIVKK